MNCYISKIFTVKNNVKTIFIHIQVYNKTQILHKNAKILECVGTRMIWWLSLLVFFWRLF